MRLLVALGLQVAPILVRSPTTPLQIENESLRLQFSPTKGALLSVFHKSVGLELLSNSSQAGQPLWILQFLNSDGSHSYADASSSTVQFTPTLTTDSFGQTLQMVWQNLRVNGNSFANTTITAAVRVQNGNPLSSWTWQAQNMPGTPVSWMMFPSFSGVGPLGATGSDDVLLWPGEDGRLLQNPWTNLGWGWGNLYPSAFTTMQFMALYDPSGGFYFGTQDTQARAKLFHFERDTQSAGDFWFRIYHQFDDVSSAALELPYDFVLGTFTGDWTTAAGIYRQWAVQQPWIVKASQKQTPQWLFDIGPGATFCAHACQPTDKNYAEGTLLRQNTAQFFQMQELSIVWGWEKYGAWYYGDYFPPWEGWPSFDIFVTSIHQIPGRVGLFISPNYITASTALWASGAMQPYAALDANGNFQSTNLDGIRQWMLMDIATPAWQQELLTYVNTLAQHGIDLVQLDGFPWNPPYECYATTHGHPIGLPATWQTSAWFSFLSAMRASAKAIKPDIAFSGEGTAEVYIPYIDMHHSRDNWFELVDSSELAVGAQPIPLFEYVYHPWMLTRGEYSLAIDTSFGLSDYQKLAIARSLTWGQEHNYFWNQAYNNPGLDMQALTYIKTATAARQGFAKPFLAYGQMLPPPAITSPMLTISWSFTGHGSGSAKFPAIQHSAWGAPAGSVGIVLTNISSQTISVSVPISFSRLGLSPNISYTVSLLDANSTSILLNQLTSDSAVTISVAPLQVELLEIAASQPLCYTLSKSANPAAGGSVTVNTASNCTGGYASGTAISLTATPATNYVFSSWTGSGGTFSNSSSSSTTFTISGNAAVTANFTLGPPGAAELLWPSGSILAATPAYSWNAVHRSTWYYLWVNDASASSKIRQWYTAQQAGCASGTGTCSVSSPAVLAQGAAQWWIQTWNDNGYGPWSSGMAFTVSGSLPGATTLISPSGTASANSPVYVWNAVPNASWYYLWVNDASASPKILQWYTAQQAGCASGTGTCSVSSPAVLAQGAAQWWIQTWNDNGYGPWSSGMAFTVSGGLPGTATLVSPSGAISTRSPMYTWNAVSNAAWYYLWVNDSTGAKVTTWYAAAQAGCASGTGTCSVTPSVTLASGAAQWWIQTWNDNGYGPWSTGMAFIVP